MKPSVPAKSSGGEIRSVGPPSTSDAPTEAPGAPFSVTMQKDAAPASASSNGAATCEPCVVPTGSARSHAPVVRLVLTTDQPASLASKLFV